MGDIRVYLASILGIDKDEMAVFAIAVGLAGSHDVAVLPFMANEGVIDQRTTVTLFARAIDTAMNA
jgi:hypothetical protein